jgi:hypothetical protein
MRGAGPHAADQGFAKKNGPGKPGPSLGGTVAAQPGRAARLLPVQRVLRGSEPRIRKLTIADRDPRVRHQKAIDGRHHAAKQRGRRQQPQRGGLGHCRPTWRYSGSLHFLQCQHRYARCQTQFLCLHGSILHFATQHWVVRSNERSPETGVRCAQTLFPTLLRGSVTRFAGIGD